ncbi:MAG: hypothetical protein KatS3mg118_2698 [Paracoccaceae bacterium]|nr:MAG: hypothetical protein KatS3mg118_2698 [Paracoccaceae bacterium]
MQLELKRLQHETGITFIFVTHDQEEALTMSDRIAVMKRRAHPAGRHAARDLRAFPPSRFVADFIGDTNFLIEVEGLAISGGRARLGLPSGAEAEAELPAGYAGNGRARCFWRWSVPEQVRLCLAAAEGGSRSRPGDVETVVYFGTDTHCHDRAGARGARIDGPAAERAGRARTAFRHRRDGSACAIERRARSRCSGIEIRWPWWLRTHR